MISHRVVVNLSVYDSGRQAYYRGVEVYENPYEHGTEAEFRVWNMGWRNAEQQERTTEQ